MSRRLFFVIFVIGSAVFAFAQHDAPPVDASKLLQDLQELKERHTATGNARLNQVVQELQAAAANPNAAVDLYTKAIHATNFEGRSRQQTQFQEWKKKEAEKLKDPTLRMAAQLHLRYLALLVRAANGQPTEELIGDLIGYTNELMALEEEKGDVWASLLRQDLMRRNIASGVFARWFGVSTEISRLSGWEMMPGNIDGIFQKTVLPEMRKRRDSSLIRYWDARLAREEKKAADSTLTFNIERFNLVTRPTLIWSRAQDVYLLGQPNYAIQQMFGLIRDYPNHPDNAKWIERLQTLLTPQAPASAETAAPADAAPAAPAAAASAATSAPPVR